MTIDIKTLSYIVKARWAGRKRIKGKKFVYKSITKAKKFTVTGRKKNTPRDRANVVGKMNDMSDEFFQRYFRLNRPTFEWLVEEISPLLRLTDTGVKRAEASSGSSISVVILLAIALRFLAGGSYLDIAFAFAVHYKTIMIHIWKTIEAIDAALDNIKFPIDSEEALRDLEQGFLHISKGIFPGTVAAGDGVVFRMQMPHKNEVNGDVASFFTRKGYYGNLSLSHRFSQQN